MSSDPAVLYHREGHVGVITLNRPDNRNSMTPELLNAFVDCTRAAREDEDARAVIITGKGRCFSAGADFKSNIQRESEGRAYQPHEASYAMYTPFLSVLDTTFVYAVLLRSLTCHKYVHLPAASNAATNRDKPMEHVGFLRVLMHEPLPPREDGDHAAPAGDVEAPRAAAHVRQAQHRLREPHEPREPNRTEPCEPAEPNRMNLTNRANRANRTNRTK